MNLLQQWQCSLDLLNPRQIILESHSSLILGTTLALHVTTSTTYQTRVVDQRVILKENEATTKWNSFLKPDTTICFDRPNQANCPPLMPFLSIDGTLTPANCIEDWSRVGKVCLWICNSDYQLTSPIYTAVRCLPTGQWNSTYFVCEHFCPSLFPPENGHLRNCTHGSNIANGEICRLECDKGYYVIGEQEKMCQWDGTWTGDRFICAKSCSSLNVTENSVIFPNACIEKGAILLPGTVCSYHCKEGFYETSKETSRTCRNNGEWSGFVPVCARVCPPLPKIKNTIVYPILCQSSDQPSGTICSVECLPGFEMIRDNVYQCLSDGLWNNSISGNDKLCQIACDSLPFIQNGQIACNLKGTFVSSSLEFYVLGTTCIIECDVGYGIQGSRVQLCENGKWTDFKPFCYREKQFLIYLSRNNDIRNQTVCLAVDENSVFKVEYKNCWSKNPLFRWTWHNTDRLKSAGTAKCLSVANARPGQQLQMDVCNESNALQKWSCDTINGNNAWILRLSDEDYYPTYGFPTDTGIWIESLYSSQNDGNDLWYALSVSDDNFHNTMEQNRMTLCTSREHALDEGSCLSLTKPLYGKIFPEVCLSSDPPKGLTCSYECDIGYQPTFERTTITCQENGIWSGPSPSCTRFCLPFAPMPHMLAHPSACFYTDENQLDVSEQAEKGIPIGEMCIMTCEENYKFDNKIEMRILCMESAEWSDTLYDCKRTCSSLDQSDHISIQPPSCYMSPSLEGDSCQVRCMEGYGITVLIKCKESLNSSVCEKRLDPQKSVGIEATTICLDDGSWSAGDVLCSPICKPLDPPENGQVLPLSCSDHPINSMVCTYHCDEGLRFNGIPQRMCVEGNWNIISPVLNETDQMNFSIEISEHIKPVCENYCSPIFSLNGKMSVDPVACLSNFVKVGTVCKVECDSDLISRGVSEVICLDDGTWSDIPATCIEKCSALPTLPNGEVFPLLCTVTNLDSGAICSFSCLPFYSLYGSSSTMCNSSGNWTNPMPICIRTCIVLFIKTDEATLEMSCSNDQILEGSTCSFKCKNGFLLFGSPTLKCESSGEWNSTLPQCLKPCERPNAPNAYLECTSYYRTSNYTEGSICEVICERGLSASSSSTITCGSDGHWLPSIPKCLETGTPMYIMQSLNSKSICVCENDGKVVQIEKTECLSSKMYVNLCQWRWMDDYNLQNSATGRCLAVSRIRQDEPIITSSCKTQDANQWWQCSTQNPFRVLLRHTVYSPSTYRLNSNEIVLQQWSDSHSFFSTLSFNTVSMSSICSRRLEGSCPPLQESGEYFIFPHDVCTSNHIKKGEICRYQCKEESAVLVGESMNLCLGNGLWLNPSPTCVDGCEILIETMPPNAIYLDPECVFNVPAVNKTCTASCLEGYELIGNPNRTCMPGGNWSKELFQCNRICPIIFGILNGMMSPPLCRSYFCNFVCDPGYVLSGPKSLFCKSDGSWDEDVPKCIRDIQFLIISLAKSQNELCMSVTELALEFVVSKAKCKEGDGSQLFKWIPLTDLLQHVQSGLCLSSSFSKWAPVLLQKCNESDPMQIWDCGDAANSRIYSLRVSDYEENSFYMDLGIIDNYPDFSIYNESEASTGLVIETNYYFTSKWKAKHYFGEGTVCSMKTWKECPPFLIPQYGKLITHKCLNHSDIHKGLVCAVSCDPMHSPPENFQSTCQQDGTWSEPLPLCKGSLSCDKITLSHQLQVFPARCTDDQVQEGVICYFSCNEDFSLSGDLHTQCYKGTWSSLPPSCVKSCRALPLVRFGAVNPPWCHGQNNIHDTECVSFCQFNFELIGSTSRVCGIKGVWSGTQHTCLSFCRKLIPPEHGTVFPARCASSSYEGNLCEFQCKVGFILMGESRIHCFDGEWSEMEPICIKANVCPKILKNDCVKDVQYKNLLNNKAIVPGTIVKLFCSSNCKLKNGMPTRYCMVNGSWTQGTPHCHRFCSILSPSAGVLLKPSYCYHMEISVGTKCYVECILNNAKSETTVVQCMEGGIWSGSMKECRTIFQSERSTKSDAFIVKQHKSNNDGNCLQAKSVSKTTGTVVSIPCLKNSSSQRWVWLNHILLQSISTQLCWAPMRKDSGIFLGLEPCNLHDNTQIFSCGDVELRQHTFQVRSGNLKLHVRDATNPVEMSSIAFYEGLDWEALDAAKDSQNVTGKTICSHMCGGTFYERAGIFSSPGYPSQYRKNTICEWIINAPGRIVYLWVNRMNLPLTIENMLCMGDKIQVFDGSNSLLNEHNILGEFCGKITGTIGPFVSLNGQLFIKFFSNDDNVGSGFLATWDTVLLPAPKTFCGKPTEDMKFPPPWHACLISLVNAKPYCAATFIHHQYLVTAAHCISDQKGTSDIVVGYGAPNSRFLSDLISDYFIYQTNIISNQSGAIIKIINRFVHPEYRYTMENDIAIVKIAQSVNFTSFPVCIPPALSATQDFNFGSIEHPKIQCSVVGWDRKLPGISQLKSVPFTLMSNHHCKEFSTKSFGRIVDSSKILCGYYSNESLTNQCENDNEISLVCQWNGNRYVAGVTTFPLGSCRDENIPRYFSRVSAFSSWIMSLLIDEGVDVTF